MPKGNTEVMSRPLEQIAFHVAPGAHAVLLLDKARWHGISRTDRAAQYHLIAAAAEMPGTQPRQEPVAVHAGQLAVQPHLHIPRRHRRPLPIRLERARRSAMIHHVHWAATVGQWVLINAHWHEASSGRLAG